MKVKDLTPEQRQWLIENFPNTKNVEVAAYLNTSLRGAIRMARELGLWKTKEFVSEMQTNAAQEAGRILRLRGGNAGAKNLLIYGAEYRFKAGVYSLADKSKNELADIYSRISTTRRETFKREQMRVKWGLEQKTKLRVVRCTSQKISLRNNLRKRGYMIERASNEALITDETRRSERMEARAESMGIRFYVNY